MLNAIIVDNEIQAIESLAREIKLKCTDVKVVACCTTMNDAVNAITDLKPDIVFLDIELDDDHTGFDVLEAIEDRSFAVIFVTAYNRYAIQAFQFSALHYLEKPVDGEMLREAVDRARLAHSAQEFKTQVRVLCEALKHSSTAPQQIILPNPKQGDSIVVPLSNILHIEAAGSQTIFYVLLNNEYQKCMYSVNIGTLQKKLFKDYPEFITIHESHIINRHHVTHYNARNHTVKMTDGTFIRIADRRLNDFLEKFKHF